MKEVTLRLREELTFKQKTFKINFETGIIRDSFGYKFKIKGYLFNFEQPIWHYRVKYKKIDYHSMIVIMK